MRISVGGSIGSGKSTILERLKENGHNVFFEPIESWKHLEKFYLDKKRWGFTFQIEVLNSFSVCESSNNIICERSPWESYNIFAKLLSESGYLTGDEFSLYESMYRRTSWKPDLFIYLKTDAEVCLERVRKRNRNCENVIDASYLEKLNILYENLRDPDVKIITIDANRTIEEVFVDVQNCLITS